MGIPPVAGARRRIALSRARPNVPGRRRDILARRCHSIDDVRQAASFGGTPTLVDWMAVIVKGLASGGKEVSPDS
jgi:hypothetical protein